MYYYLYILYSKSADKYYIGHTSDYQRRFEEHNHQDHFDTYTSKHRPWELKAVFQIPGDRANAMKIERFIKSKKTED